MRQKYRKNPTSSVRTGIIPTKERCRQNGGVASEIIGADVSGRAFIRRYRAACECALDAYWNSRLINEPAYRAGLVFRRAYYRAVLSRRAAYERLSLSTAPARLTYSERLLKHAYRILSPYTMRAVIDICGHDERTQDRQKLDNLQKGLNQLSILWKAAAADICER